MKKLLSLVVTAHRREYLTEALFSVCAQTHKKFELVLCIDTSIDEGLCRFIEPLFNIIQCDTKKMIVIKGNGTAGHTRNTAITSTSGEWIAYLDGDDMLFPTAIERMMYYMSENKKYSIFSSGMIRIHKNGQIQMLPQSLNYYPPKNIYTRDPELFEEATFFNSFQLMRRSCWEYYQYDETTNGEDVDFILHQLLKFRFLKVPEYLYYYRDVENSFSKEIYKNKNLTSNKYINGYYKQLYEAHKFFLIKDNFDKND